MNRRLASLEAVYQAAHEWSTDSEAVQRKLEAVNSRSRLALVAEAFGPTSVRLSGVNYFGANGTLGATGRYLDILLEPVGYSVFPAKDVRLAAGVVPSRPRGERETAYFTDLCPEFPGHAAKAKGRSRIARPRKARVREALEAGFLARELHIVRPRAIVLLGASAYSAFFTHFLNRQPTRNLTEYVSDLGSSDLPSYKGMLIVPFLHPSPASPVFSKWFRLHRDRLASTPLIRRIIEAVD